MKETPVKPHSTASASDLLALFAAIEKQLGPNIKLQDYLRSTIADAIAAQTRAAPITALVGKEVGSMRAKLPADVTSPGIEYFWWGFHVVCPEDFIKWLVVQENIEAAFYAFLAAVISGPALPFLAAMAANMAIEAALIPAIDQGKGIYQSMLWIAPGVFVNTAIT